jgi:ribosome-binding factor A
MAPERMRRVDQAVRAVLSDAIAKDLKDPRIGFVTVTAVKTSPDLRHARVYVSVFGDEPTRIASELTLKRTPSLEFEYDETVERADRISRLIDQQVGDA